MEYCYQVWAGSPNFYLNLLDMLVYRAVGPALTCFSWTVISSAKIGQSWHVLWVLLWKIFLTWLLLVPLPHCRGWSTDYSDRWYGFTNTIPRCSMGVHVNTFSLQRAGLRKSLPVDYFEKTGFWMHETFCLGLCCSHCLFLQCIRVLSDTNPHTFWVPLFKHAVKSGRIGFDAFLICCFLKRFL